MVSINQIIQREVNPFDSTTFRPGNFWQEDQDPLLTVNSIHQEIVTQVEGILDQVASDRRTRTLMLAGDSGSGKSYLLGRLKARLNPKAFFAYIGPWPESDFIWRHTLRNTVDSLMYVPGGQQESQLLLWLKSLSAFRDNSLMRQLLGERHIFIHNLKNTFPSGIYNSNEFFGVLYALTNPELYPLACEWLKGDDLDEESLKLLRVKKAIDTEDAAQKILGNIGRVAAETQPIVLCFDNLDNIDRALDGFINLQALFNVNSIIHNQKLKNFLVIVSIITNTWNENAKRVQSADRARIDLQLRLQAIDLDQAEALWGSRLYPLHQLADKKPRSRIYPLKRETLEKKFPGGKTLPRYVLMLGRQLFQAAKGETIDHSSTETLASRRSLSLEFTHPDLLAAFKLLWRKELHKTEETIGQIRHFSAPELMQMMREALVALQVRGIQTKLLTSPTYGSYSLSYHLPVQLGRIGIVWTEDGNLRNFCNVMKACEKVLKQQLCQTLYLVRAETVGTPSNLGYKLYTQIFTGFPHRHLIPDIGSVYYLSTYHNLVNAACAGELVLGDRTPDLKDLQALVRESQVLQECALLQNLGIFKGYTRIIGVREPAAKKQRDRIPEPQPIEPSNQLQDVKDFLLNLVKTQQMMGREVLMQNALDEFTQVKAADVNQLIQQLCQEKQIFILDPQASVEAQLVCLVKK